MELKTSGKMQVGGFQRTISASSMKLHITKPMDKSSPEHYMDSKTKRYWRMLPEREKSKVIERAQQQAIQSQGTIFMQQAQPAPSGRPAAAGYRVGRGGRIKTDKVPAGSVPRQAVSIIKVTGAGSLLPRIQAPRLTKTITKAAYVHLPGRKPGGKPGRYASAGRAADAANGAAPPASMAGQNTSPGPLWGRAAQQESRGHVQYMEEDIRCSTTQRAGGAFTGAYAGSMAQGGGSGNAGAGGQGAAYGAGNQGKAAAAATATGGGEIAIQAAKKAAQAVKNTAAAVMQKEDEQRNYNSEAILSEESSAGQAAAASPRAAEAGIQKVVAAVVAFTTAMLQSAVTVLLPLVAILPLLLSVVISVLSIFFGGAGTGYAKANVSEACERYRPLVSQYAAQYGMSDYVELLLAVMMQESGGLLPDVMQAAEGAFNTRYPHVPNGIPDPEYSIECGVQELKRALELAGATGPTDMEHIKLALQGYNYGEGYITWALSHYGGYSPENAAEFSDMMAARMGWSNYGDKLYVDHVLQYYEVKWAGGSVSTSEISHPETKARLEELSAMWPPDVSEGRKNIIAKGCTLAGYTTYDMYGEDTRSGADLPRTLDCSSFVAWCFQKCGYTDVPYWSTTGTFLNSPNFRQIQASQLKPGDIGLMNWVGEGGSNHVGIYVGCDAAGTPMWLHCTSYTCSGSSIATGPRISYYPIFSLYFRYTGFGD